MAAQSAKIEAGAVFLPRQAPWLDDLRAEILAFLHGMHDDQVELDIPSAELDVPAACPLLCNGREWSYWA